MILKKKELNSLFFNQLEVKEQKDSITFHDSIQYNKGKLIKYFISNPDFMHIVKYDNDNHHHYRNSDLRPKSKAKPYLKQPIISSLIRHQSSVLKYHQGQSRNTTTNNNNNSVHLPSIIQYNNTHRDRDKVLHKAISTNDINKEHPLILHKSQSVSCLPNNNSHRNSNSNSTSKHKSNPINIKTIRYTNRNHLSTIYQRCQSEISKAQSIDNEITRSTVKFNKKIKLVKNSKEKISTITFDKLIINDKAKKSKYDLLRDQNLQLMRQRVNQQVSEGLAYNNQSEFIKGFTNYQDEPYQLFLIDLNKEKKTSVKTRQREDYKLEYINYILDSTVKDKEVLKQKIDYKEEVYKQENYVNNNYNKGRRKRKDKGNKNKQQDEISEKDEKDNSLDAIEREVYNEFGLK